MYMQPIWHQASGIGSVRWRASAYTGGALCRAYVPSRRCRPFGI